MRVRYIKPTNETFVYGRIYNVSVGRTSCKCKERCYLVIDFLGSTRHNSWCDICKHDQNSPLFNTDIFVVVDINNNIKVI